MILSIRCRIQVSLAALWVAAAASGLTESEALRLFRQGPYPLELQAAVAAARADALRHSEYPNPSVGATFEGAGRTDFFVVEQPLSVNGRRNLLRQAGSSAVRATETRVEHGLRQLEARLRESFFQLVHAQSRKALIGRGIEELEGLVRTLRERELAGDVARFDRLRAEREVAKLEIEASEADTLIAAARARLASFLGDAVSHELILAEGSLQAAYGLPGLHETLSAGLAARSDYKVETERLEQLRLEGKAAERRRIPNPVVLGGVKRAEVRDGFVTGPVVSVSIDVPVFDKGRADRALAEAEADRTRARRRILEGLILADIRGAHDALRIRRQVARDHVEQAGTRARLLLEIARLSFDEGELAIADLLDAFRDVHLTRLRQLELQAAAKLAEVEFDRSVARELLP